MSDVRLEQIAQNCLVTEIYYPYPSVTFEHT